MESAYSFKILYNFCIASHSTITHLAIYWIGPNHLYRCVYAYFLLYLALGMSKFTHFSHMINYQWCDCFLSSFILLVDLWKYTSLSSYLGFCIKIYPHCNLNVLSYFSRFWLDRNDCFVFNYYSVKGTNFFMTLLLSEDKTSEIVQVPMASLFSLKLFERYNARYYCNMLFTPREIFTYVVIITLTIIMLIQLILQIVCISFTVITIDCYSSRGNSKTWRLLPSMSFCDQHGWLLPE